MALAAGTRQALTDAAAVDPGRSKAVEAVLDELRALTNRWGGATVLAGLQAATLQALAATNQPDRALARAAALELAALREVKRLAEDTLFAATVLGDWDDPPPEEVQAALDALAARKGEHHLVFFASAVGVAFDETGIITLGPAVDLLTSDTTLTTSHNIVLVDATAGAVTLTLPAVATYVGPGYTIKKIDASANAVTIDGSGAETIDDTTTRILTMQYNAVEVMSDGTEWWLHVK